MAKKSKTPLLVAIAAGLGIYLWRSKKAKAQPLIVVEPDPDPVKPTKPTGPGGPVTPPSQKGKIPSDAIGGGLNWKPKSVWPDFATIAVGFMALGYGNVPGSALLQSMRQNPQLMLDLKPAIKQFQKDYKYAIKFVTAFPQPTLSGVVDGKNAPSKKGLVSDGWLGKSGWPAFKWAHKNATDAGADLWQGWVKAGKDMD